MGYGLNIPLFMDFHFSLHCTLPQQMSCTGACTVDTDLRRKQWPQIWSIQWRRPEMQWNPNSGEPWRQWKLCSGTESWQEILASWDLKTVVRSTKSARAQDRFPAVQRTWKSSTTTLARASIAIGGTRFCVELPWGFHGSYQPGGVLVCRCSTDVSFQVSLGGSFVFFNGSSSCYPTLSSSKLTCLAGISPFSIGNTSA